MQRNRTNRNTPKAKQERRPAPAEHRDAPVPDDRTSMLKRMRLFHAMTSAELADITPKIIFKDYRKGQIILHEQDTNNFMYIIIRGKVKIHQVSDEGKEMILSMHNAGDFFGEMSLLDGKTDPATVTATEPSMIALISRDDFYYLLHSQKKVLENLLGLLCSRLRESWKKIQMLNFNDASQRIKMLFLILADDYGEKTDEGMVLRIRLIHQNIADMTGLTRETVTRVLDKWKSAGEISMTKDKYIHLHQEFESIQL